MARIPENEIERLKNEVSVQRLIEAAGIALKTGKDLTGKCPVHEDDNASLVVTPAKNLWHCFGCGAAGAQLIGSSKRTASVSVMLSNCCAMAFLPFDPAQGRL